MATPTFAVRENVTASLLGHGLIREQQLEKLVAKTALDLQGDMRRAMAAAKHGRVYASFRVRKGGKGKRKATHTASAPGEAPAIDTGALTNSITIRPGRHRLEKVVVVTSEYGLYLEMGTRRIQPRPFMAPAVGRAAPLFTRRVRAIMTGFGKGTP